MKKNINERISYFLINFILFIFCVSTVLPTILTIMVSITDEKSVIHHGYRFIPEKFSFEAYRVLFSNGMIFNAYKVTIIVTALGTLLSIIICSMLGYAISSPKVKYRNKIALFLYIPMVFSAGLVPWYIVITKYLDLKNSFWVLILPSLVSSYNVFLLRNYFKSLPASVMESAEIDGAGPFYTFWKIVLPLSVPIIATVSLFVSLGYWNDWYLALWFIDKKELYPLQYMMYRIQSLIMYMSSNGGQSVGKSGTVPSETTQLATMIVTIGPIILVYPYVQKYFIKGIMVGAIKG